MIQAMINTCHRVLAAKLYELDKWRSGQQATVSYLHEFQQTQNRSLQQIRARQRTALQDLVKHAYDNCPFYRRRLDEAGLPLGEIRGLSDLAKIPLLEKRDIQEHQSSMVATNWPKADLIANHTGGSTGEPVPLFLNQDRRCQREAGAWRHNAWAGARPGDKVAYVWGAVFDLPTNGLKVRLRNWLIDRSLYLNTGDLTEQRMREFCVALNEFQPTAMIAYARSLALVARFFKREGLQPHRPDGIITSAETLSDEDRAVIEEVFRSQVFNRYGCREVSVIASECRHGGMHTMAECLIVEVVNAEGQPCAPGETGSIIVTDLFNFAMPLIRYRIGDMGALRDTPCDCGRELPMLEHVAGRVTDFLVGRDGRLVSGVYVATYLIGKCPGLGKVQVVQNHPGELAFKVTKVPSESDRDFVIATSKKMFGDDVQVDIEHVSEIPRTRSGKLVLCQSNATVNYLANSSETAEVSSS